MNIREKLLLVQGSLKAPKQQMNDFGGYKYRSCDDIIEAAKPLLSEHGLILLMEDELMVVGERYYIKATVRVVDIDGEFIQSQAYAREPMNLKGQSDSQVTGTASTYARKYALNGLFAIDDSTDPDSLDNRVSAEQLKDYEKLTASLNADHKKILAWIQGNIDPSAKSIKDLSSHQMDRVLMSLKKKAKK